MQQARIEGAFGIENLRWVDAPDPTPGFGEVVVRVRATCLNYRDYLVATGKYNPRMPLPRVPLSDGAGEVVGVGAGVTRWKLGDRVAGCFMQTWIDGAYREEYGKSALGGAVDGMLSEFVALHETGCVAVPEHLNFEEAATLPCAAVTAWNALFESGSLRPGQTVLVQGSGGVSVFALQFAKAAGARVIATSSSSQKLERLRQMGADEVLNYREDASWGRTLARRGGVDHVVEVGGAGSLEQSLMAVNGGGTVSVIGVLTGILGQINIGPILHKHLRVQGIYVGSRTMFENMNRLVAQQQLRPVVDRVFTGAEIQSALRHLEAAGHFGKIVITV
jgi:NADPH:quinone reductase-like Zn-dependent oxidoreductase